jgi:hypothetical protein
LEGGAGADELASKVVGSAAVSVFGEDMRSYCCLLLGVDWSIEACCET